MTRKFKDTGDSPLPNIVCVQEEKMWGKLTKWNQDKRHPCLSKSQMKPKDKGNLLYFVAHTHAQATKIIAVWSIKTVFSFSLINSAAVPPAGLGARWTERTCGPHADSLLLTIKAVPLPLTPPLPPLLPPHLFIIILTFLLLPLLSFLLLLFFLLFASSYLTSCIWVLH